MKEEECIQLKAYKKWNECNIQCDNEELQPKTKLYKSKKWVKPKSHVHP